jgi:translocation and assembly module TamB
MTSRRAGRFALVALAILFAVLALLTVGSWLAVRAWGPALARERLESVLSAALDRPVHVAGVSVEPWLGRVVVRGLGVPARPDDPGAPVATLARAELRIGISSLWQRRLVLRRIVLDDADLALAATGPGGGGEIPMIPEVVRAGPVEIRIGVVELRRARIGYRDATRHQHIEVRQLDATLEPASTSLSLALTAESLALDLPGLSERVERIRAEGRLFADRIEVQRLGFSWMGHEASLSGRVDRPLDGPSLALDARGRVDLAALASRTGVALPLEGLASVGGRVDGPVDALRGDAHVEVETFAGGPLTARRVVLDARGTLRGPVGAPDADLRVSAKALTLGPVAVRDFTARGRVGAAGSSRAPLAELALAAREVVAGPVTASQVAGDLRWAEGIVAVRDLTARALGGTLAGSLHADPARLDATRLTVRARDLSLAAVERLTGGSSGTAARLDVDAHATGDPRRPVEIGGGGRVQARQVTLPGRLARAGTGTVVAEGRFDGPAVDLARAVGRWPGVVIEVGGHATPDGPRPLRVRAALDLARVGEIAGRPGLVGHADVEAEATGTWRAPEIAGRIDARAPGVGALTADALRLPFAVSGRTARLDEATLASGQSRVMVSGTLSLTPEASLRALRPEDVGFRLRARTAGARLEDAGRWLPEVARGAGALGLAAEIDGTLAAWHAAIRAESPGLSVGSLPEVTALAAAFTLANDRIEVSDLRARVLGAPLQGTGSWRWAGHGEGRAEIGPVDLSRLPQVPSALALQGAARAAATAVIRNGEISGSSTLSAEGVALAGIEVGHGGGALSLERGQVRASLDFPDARLALSGQGRLDGPAVFTVAATAREIALAPLVRRFAPEAEGQVAGSASATATLDIPLRDPGALRGAIRVDPLRLDLAGETFEAQGPVLLRREPGRLLVDRLQMASRLGTISGRARLDDAGPVEASVEGRIPLEVLAALRPEISEARGSLDLDLRVGGTRDRPVLGGTGRVAGGLLALRDLPEALRGMEGRLAFSADRLRIEDLRAALRGGTLRATGEVAIEGRALGSYQVSIAARNVPSPPLQGLESSWDADLELVGRGARALLGGEARLLRGVYTRELALLPLLLERPAREQAADVGRTVGLRVRIDLQDNVVVRTRQAHLRGGGTLMLAGTLAAPVVLGTVETRAGTLKFRGHRFRVETAAARFDDPRRPDPVLDMRATTRIRTYDVTMEATGRLEDLTIRLSSVPPLPQEDLVALVTFGKTRAELGASAATVFAGEAARLLAEEVLGLEASGLALDVLDVERSGPEGTRVTAGKRLDERTLVVYSGSFAEGGKQKLRIEYEVFGPLLLSGEQDFQGGVAGDIVLRFRFR